MPVDSTNWTRNGWTDLHLMAVLIMVFSALWVCREAWQDIFLIAARDEENSHIFLVPFVMFWLVWVRRQRFRFCYPTGQWVGPLIAGLGAFMSWYGYNHAVQASWHVGAVVIAVGAFTSVMGTQVLWRFAPAFVTLLFLVPVPGLIRQEIAIPLQRWTALITTETLTTFGVSVSQSGSVLEINGMQVGIAEACNGMRMVFALLLVSFAFAFGTPLRNSVRVFIVLLSPVSAILCNVVRLSPTVWVYGALGEGAGKLVHDLGGWVMIGVAFFLLLGIKSLLEWALIPVTPYVLARD
ncbi:exosortase/archaeosortase family protein [Mucisphaera calidilacus]|uniref:Transmembrane exosortase (Exosortase_EpsH) n=1 Tax=Mucisphaera calidilacus TaxID=2527982 RepID=A0A518BVI5_9BACT|nr:exosortase/archaeosortase family protein [Mucisphaera calidilacus]QDU70971.1 Transmembrane exosortase (Exosortase_EpsH) [Mucisphaera calidilacus]